ncbi:MAG TPA: hypothetical protein VMN77_03890 [Nitrospiria bacterium]|nr:hypothetical protein [Nitrospiria bacterium]
MLKITTQMKAGILQVVLEGELAGPWVKELELSWRSATGSRPGPPVRVDLSSVAFIDEEGQGLLEKMHGEGVELKASGCMNKCIIERIIRPRG